MLKNCFKCNIEKPLEEFYKHRQMADGHLNKCKTCTKKDSNKHRSDNIEAVREYDRQRGCLDHRKEKVKVYSKTHQGKLMGGRCKKEYIVRNPIKRKAHLLVRKALLNGRLLKSPCEECGSQNKNHAHHDDYGKPLEIRWLCPQCHKAWHKYNSPINGN